MTTIQFILAIATAILASNGLWGFITYKVKRKDGKQDAVTQGLLAVLHDRLYQACKDYLSDAYVPTVDEFDNLKYLYNAYHALGGNGTGTELYERCCKLPIREVQRDA